MNTTHDTFRQTLNEFANLVEDYGQRHPHVVAHEHMQGRDGPQQILDLDSARLWEAILEANPDDALAGHHLAIIQHGTAYRLHHTADQRVPAVDNWRRGLEAWKRLLDHDAFWTGLRNRWEQRHVDSQGADMIAERLVSNVDLKSIRRQIPQFLLKVHLTIVQETMQQDPVLAGLHLDLIRNGPFAGPYADRLCENLFRDATTNFDALCAAYRFNEARQQVETFLKVDPGNDRALEHLLKVTCLEVERMVAEEKNFEAMRQKMQAAAPAAERLTSSAAIQSTLTGSVIQEFYCEFTLLFLSEAHKQEEAERHSRALQLYGEAVDPALRAVHVELASHLSVKRGRSLLSQVFCTGTLANLFNNRDDTAVADRLETRCGDILADHPLYQATRAFYYFVKRKNGLMAEALKEAERLNRVAPDSEVTSMISKLHELARDPEAARQQECLNNAKQALEQDDPARALQILRDAGDSADTHALRSKCHVRQLNSAMAKKEFDLAKKLAGSNPSPGIKLMLREIELLLQAS